MLFRKSLAVCAALILFLAALVCFFLVRLRSSDAPRYRKLVQESAELRSRHALEREPAHQMREGVQKDIWIVDEAERLHFRLNSRYSELMIRQKKDKVEAVEELQQIECWIQEEVDSKGGKQLVRQLKAAEGVYTYPSHRFVAGTVHLAFFRMPGTELPRAIQGKPYLTGLAREASFAATSKLPTFTAYHLTATLDPEQGLP